MTYQDSLTALADPTRRTVFEQLAQCPKSVGTLAQDLPVSRPAVSQHLKVLSDAGLVTCNKQGNKNIYSVAPHGLAELRAWLDQYWGDVMESFANEINKNEYQND